jgi:hypothetical protein
VASRAVLRVRDWPRSVLSHFSVFASNRFVFNQRVKLFLSQRLVARNERVDKLSYPWKRFWCQRKDILQLGLDGYLVDPEETNGLFQNNSAKSFPEIASIPCLVLLGEPGIGKSKEVNDASNNSMQEIKNTSDHVLQYDLGSFGSEDRLEKAIIGNPQVVTWAKGSGILYLFLDSLDEGLLGIGNLCSVLVDCIKTLPINRLRLRIACRTAAWLPSFEDSLITLYSEKNIGVFELCPLRKRDVIAAVTMEGKDPKIFLKQVERNNAESLASRPITLKFLLKAKDAFSDSRVELYRKGTLRLCHESNQKRVDERRVSQLSDQEKWLVAGRIAVVSIFSNRYAIWTGVDETDVPDEDVWLDALIGGEENFANASVKITKRALKETLNTGLFTSRGRNRMGWAHQSYVEFLAAAYLDRYKFDSDRTMSLLTVSSDSDRKVVPQLHQTAAWLASFSLELMDSIAQTSPEVLLQSDIAGTTDETRANVVCQLLKQIENDTIKKWFWKEQLEKLSHNKLAEQLRPYLSDTSKNRYVRDFAIETAHACNLIELEADLLALVRNFKEDYLIRSEATKALSEIASGKIIRKLEPFAKSDPKNDPDDQIRGNALRALWPKHFSTKKLFDILDKPNRDNIFGAYQVFLYSLPDKIKAEDLFFAIKWTGKQEKTENSRFDFRFLIAKIFWKGWENFEDEKIRTIFIDTIYRKLQNHEEVFSDLKGIDFNDMIEKADDRRRKIIEHIIHKAKTDVEIYRIATSDKLKLFYPKDVKWAIDKIQTGTRKENQLKWAKFLYHSRDLRDASFCDSIIIAAKSNNAVKREFRWWLGSVDIHSDEAMKMRKEWEDRHSWQRREKKAGHLDTEKCGKKIFKELRQFEKGNWNSWLNIVFYSENFNNIDSEERLPGDSFLEFLSWVRATKGRKLRICKAAEKFLKKVVPNNDRIIETAGFSRLEYAGYRAFKILVEAAPKRFGSLSSSIWKKWVASIVLQPRYNTPSSATYDLILKKAFEHAPKEMRNAISGLIDTYCRNSQEIYLIDRLDSCWEKRTEQMLFDKVKRSHIKPKQFGQLIEKLLERDVPGVEDYAHRIVKSGKRSRKRAVQAAVQLIRKKEDASWTFIWPILKMDTSFAKETIDSLVIIDQYRNNCLVAKLKEEDLAHLYIWVENRYPHTLDPDETKRIAGPITHKMKIQEWRDAIPKALRGRGSAKSVFYLEYLVRKLPHLEELKWFLAEAKDAMRRLEWVSPEPEEILKLCSHNEMRLVRNRDELLEAIIQSLKEFERGLHGETPAIHRLWNNWGKKGEKKYQPKNETVLSVEIKLHLQNDLQKRGVLINREVEIKRISPSGGQKVDLLVECISQKSGVNPKRLAVIIEVKGSWNKDVKMSIKTQLRDRYLSKIDIHHGIYLIGWFGCEKWDKADYKKKQAPPWNLEEAQKYFNTEAKGLSSESKKIKAFVMDTAYP